MVTKGYRDCLEWMDEWAFQDCLVHLVIKDPLVNQAFPVHQEDLDFQDLTVLRVKGVSSDCMETLASEDGVGPRVLMVIQALQELTDSQESQHSVVPKEKQANQVLEGNQGLMESLVWMVSRESQENLVRSLMVVLESLDKGVNLASTRRMVSLDCRDHLVKLVLEDQRE
jgi:hypothetical protein